MSGLFDRVALLDPAAGAARPGLVAGSEASEGRLRCLGAGQPEGAGSAVPAGLSGNSRRQRRGIEPLLESGNSFFEGLHPFRELRDGLPDRNLIEDLQYV